MIQRIQSIYLVLAGIFPAFTFFVPLVCFTSQDTNKWFTINSLGYDATLFPEMAGHHPYAMLIFAALAVIFSLVAIFAFKNRKKQIKFANWAISCNVIWAGITIVQCIFLSKETTTSISPELGLCFPILALIMLFLAKHAIKRDEALVRAADRIR